MNIKSVSKQELFNQCRKQKNTILLLFCCLMSFMILSINNENQKIAIIMPDIVNSTELKNKAILDYYTKVFGNKEAASYAIKYANQNNIELSLLIGIIKAESNFDPYAINYNETSIDRGYCQLNSATFYHLTESDFFNPEINISEAANFLRVCLKKANNNTIKALAYYNAGIGAVKRGRVPEKTIDYIDRVLRAKEKYDRDLSLLSGGNKCK